MPVGVMLRTMSSREIAEWAAYEKLTGPLGDQYSDVTLASLHEQGQLTNYLLGALYASWTEEKNPIQVPEQIKRPNQVFDDEEPAETEESEEDSEEQAVPSGYVSWRALAAQMELDQGKK